MAHMRKHKGAFMQLNVRLPRELVGEFKDLCRKHNTTTCHVLMTLIKAWLKGEELGMVSLSSPNPVIINVHETFLGKPRSAWKTPLQESCKLWPPSCEFADDFIRSIREVGCTSQKEWVGLEECWNCFQRGGRQL